MPFSRLAAAGGQGDSDPSADPVVAWTRSAMPRCADGNGMRNETESIMQGNQTFSNTDAWDALWFILTG